jgi:hypothetical protein
MPGGLMQLTAYGDEDLYLTGNPQITFFKLVYRRYSNFSMEYIPQIFTNIPNFQTTSNTKVYSKIERNGDLMYDIYLTYKLPALFLDEEDKNNNIRVGWVDYIGNNIIYSVDINVGGQRLDIQYGQWMTIWNELTLDNSKKKSYNKIIGNTPNNLVSNIEYNELLLENSGNYLGTNPVDLYIPLNFWFCKNPGLAIPLIALQYTEIFINVEFNELNKLLKIGVNNKDMISINYLFSNSPELDQDYKNYAEKLVNRGYDSTNLFFKYTPGWTQFSELLVNYVYLDEDERKRFAQVSHEYLITGVQRLYFSGLKTGPNILDLSILKHCVKEIIWTIQNPDVMNYNNWNNYTLIPNVESLKYEESISYLSKNNLYNSINKDLIDNCKETFKMKDLFDSVYDLGANGITEDNINLESKNIIDIMNSSKLKFNGIDRFSIQNYNFFNGLQIYKYHTNSGLDGVYVYSFSLNPEDEQPSGTCNMSRLQKIEIIINLQNISPKINFNMELFATNYNIFRIMAGIGGLVFAN